MREGERVGKRVGWRWAVVVVVMVVMAVVVVKVVVVVGYYSARSHY